MTEVYVAHHERVVFATVAPTGARVVVKADADPDRLAREVAVHRAAGTAILVPEIVNHWPGLLVMAFLDGVPLVSASPDAAWTAVGTALRRLHNTAVTEGLPSFAGADGWNNWFRERVPGWRRGQGLLPPAVTARLCDTIEQALANAPEPPARLLHGDSSTIHWRLPPEGHGRRQPATGAAALDFGDGGLGDPLWDLVVLTHWDADRLPAVLDGYRPDTATRRRLDRLYEPYRVARHLLAVDWLVDHGYDPTPTLDELTRIAGTIGRGSARTGG